MNIKRQSSRASVKKKRKTFLFSWKRNPDGQKKTSEVINVVFYFWGFQKNLENQPVLPDTENKQKASFHKRGGVG